MNNISINNSVNIWSQTAILHSFNLVANLSHYPDQDAKQKWKSFVFGREIFLITYPTIKINIM